MAKSPDISAKGFGDSELQLVVFKIQAEEFGVEIDTVQEIIRMVNITEIPGAPPYVKGLINLRGHIIVVITLSTIMRVESRELDANTRIIVADVDGTIMGFIVDSVSEVIRLPAKSIEPTPSIITSKIRSEYIRGVGKINERLLILLNLNKMLSSEELIHIQNMSSEIAEAAAT
jgi:purine-binding chemotaxis protein CheW